MNNHSVANKGALGQIWDDISEKFRRFKREHYADCANFSELTGLEWKPANHYSGGTEGFTYVTYQTSVATTHNTAKKLVEIMNAHLVLDRDGKWHPWQTIQLDWDGDGINLVIYPDTYKELVRRPEFDAAALKRGCLAFVENLQQEKSEKDRMRLAAYTQS